MIDRYKYEREKLREKLKQLDILNEMYNKRAPKETVEEILRGIEEPDEVPKLSIKIIDLDRLKERHDELARKIQELNAQ